MSQLKYYDELASSWVPVIVGARGATGPTGPQGIQGETGATGLGIQLKGAVADVASLPSTGQVQGDAYVVEADGDLYVWDGVEWIDSGNITGPTGAQGATGPTGAQGEAGPTGPQGEAGPGGIQGDAGAPLTILGSVADYNELDAITGQSINDAYIVQSDGDLWIWDGSDWIDAGQIVGPTGATGPTGAQGIEGPTGPTGAHGDVGPTGAQGVQGVQGVEGIQGDIGPTGPANVLTVGTVTTGAPAANAVVTITGTSPSQTIDLTIPQGPTGPTGASGSAGVVAATSPITVTGPTGSVTIGITQSSITIAQSQVTSLTSDLALKSPLASPTFTGTPAAPTASANTNTTQVATTAFVVGQAANTAPAINGIAATGTSLRYARQDHVHASDTTKANLDSPTLTGVPAAPTAAANTNSTQVATTAYVVGQAASSNPLSDGTAAIGTSLRYARQDHVHPSDTSRAPLDGPTFTGVVTAAELDVNGVVNVESLTATGNVISHVDFNSQTADYTLQLSDDGKIIEVDSSSDITITLSAGVLFTVGTQITIMRVGTGLVTVAETGVTLNATPGKKLRARYSTATLVLRPDYSWVLFGDLSA